ncbi:MAG: hypothetical protein ACRDQV_03955 [Pseudonocardiaceae bacterium]
MHVLPFCDCSQQQVGEWFGRRGWRFSEPDPDLAVVVADDVIDTQPGDSAGWLGVEQHQAAGDAGAQRRLVVGEDPTQQGQSPALGDPLAGVGFAQRRKGELGRGERAGTGARGQPRDLIPATELGQHARARDQATQRLFTTLAEIPKQAQRLLLDELLDIEPGGRVSRWERWRTEPVKASAPGVAAVLARKALAGSWGYCLGFTA